MIDERNTENAIKICENLLSELEKVGEDEKQEIWLRDKCQIFDLALDVLIDSYRELNKKYKKRESKCKNMERELISRTKKLTQLEEKENERNRKE